MAVTYHETADSFDLRELTDKQVIGLIIDSIMESAIRFNTPVRTMLDSVVGTYDETVETRDLPEFAAFRASL